MARSHKRKKRGEDESDGESDREPAVTFSCGCKRCDHFDADELVALLEALDPDALVEIRSAPGRGWFLTAREDIKAGTFVGAVRCVLRMDCDDTFNTEAQEAHDVDFRASPEMRAMLLGGPWRTHMWARPTQLVLSSLCGQTLRYGNLPTPPSPKSLAWGDAQMAKWVQAEHNAAIVLIQNWLAWAVFTCKDVAKGEELRYHYGPVSASVAHGVVKNMNRG